MPQNNKYRFIEFRILVLAVVLFIKYSGISLTNGTAGAFEWEKEVNVYFVDLKKAETSSCEADVAVKRTVPNSETLGPGAIDMLLKGLTADEEKSYFSAIDEKTMLQKFEIKDKVAYVDFNSALNEGVAGSCAVIAIRSQIEKTLTDLPDIDSVVISVNGQTGGILEP